MPNRFQHQAGSTIPPKLYSALSRFFTIPNWIDRIEATDVADGLDDIRTAFREAIGEQQLSGGTPKQVFPAMDPTDTPTTQPIVGPPSALAVLRKYLVATLSEMEHKESPLSQGHGIRRLLRY